MRRRSVVCTGSEVGLGRRRPEPQASERRSGASKIGGPLRRLRAPILVAMIAAAALCAGGCRQVLGVDDIEGLPPCSSFENPILVYGSDSVPPVLAQIAPKLAADPIQPLTVIYVEDRSCNALSALYAKGPVSASVLETGVGCVFPSEGAASDELCADAGGVACALDADLPVAIAVSDIFPETCGLPKVMDDIENETGPIQAAMFVTAACSQEDAITWEEANAVYSPASAEMASPWTNEAHVLRRIEASGTQRLIAKTLDIDPAAMRGVEFKSSSDLIAEVEAAEDGGDPALCDQLIGIYDVSNGDRKTKDGAVGWKALGFRNEGQSAAFLPDASGYDKANVRSGDYQIWSPIHFAFRADLPESESARRVVDLIRMAPDASLAGITRAEVLGTWASRSFVPDCAMQVERSDEMGPLTPREATCTCAFEDTLKVVAAGACERCNEDDNTCPATHHCDYRFGYCEPNE